MNSKIFHVEKMHKVIDAMTARKRFGVLLDEIALKGDSVTIKRHNKPMAVMISIEEAQRKGLVVLPEENVNITDDPLFQMNGYDSNVPSDFSSNPDQYLYE